MSNAIGLDWALCSVQVAGGGGFSHLVGVPTACVALAALRLKAIGASQVTILPSGAIEFRSGRIVREQLLALFPTCPLACPLP